MFGWLDLHQFYCCLSLFFRSTETIGVGAAELSKQASKDLPDAHEEPAKSDVSEYFGGIFVFFMVRTVIFLFVNTK